MFQTAEGYLLSVGALMLADTASLLSLLAGVRVRMVAWFYWCSMNSIGNSKAEQIPNEGC